jgi:hypothetical protein
MHMRRWKRFAAAGVAALLGSVTVAAPVTGAQEEPGAPAPTSLAELLLADGDEFDRNAYDFDIVTQAVLAVLAEKPDSAVSVLLDGEQPVTAFIPNDRAFWTLVGDLTGKYYGFFTVKEQKVFEAVASLGIDTVETVLLYHVVRGATIDSDTAANVPFDTPLATAQGGDIRVRPIVPAFKWIALGDNDPDDFDPFVIPSKFDINAGNPQIAHGIAFVLRPVDL